MSIIALFNLAKEYLVARHTNRTFRHLDDHYLKDLGFYRDNGQIRPLAGSQYDQNLLTPKAQIPPGEHGSDG